MALYLDIECRRSTDEAELEAAFPLPPEPPSVPDKDTLPYKGAKDPVKVAAWRESKHAELVEAREAAIEKARIERDENIRKAWESSAIDALRGGVLCVGVARDDNTPSCIFEPSEEKTLRALEQGLAAYPDHTIVGFNIIGFDAPFLARRALKFGFYSLARRMFIDKPWGRRGMVDVRQVWAMGDRYAKGKLTDVARHLGIETPDDGLTGADVPRLWHEACGLMDHENVALIRKKVISDVELTRKVAHILETAGLLDAA